MSGTVFTCKQTPDKVVAVLIIIDVVCSTVSAVIFGMLSLIVIFTAGNLTTAEILRDAKFVKYEDRDELKDPTDPAFIAANNERTGLVKKTGYLMFLIVILTYMLELYLYRLIRDGMDIDHLRICRKWLALRILVFVGTIALHVYIAVVIAFNFLQVPALLYLFYAAYELVVGLIYVKDLHSGITFHGSPPDWQKSKFVIP